MTPDAPDDRPIAGEPTTPTEEKLLDLVNRYERQRTGLTIVVWGFAAFALLAATFAVGFGLRAVDESKGSGSSGTSAGAVASVSLSEFKLSPEMVDATTGGGLDVKNDGTIAHNLAVEGTDLKTPDIQPGASAHLDLSSLKAGDYTIVCLIAGHKEAGMKGMLMVTEGGATQAAAGGASSTTPTTMTSDQMDASMKAGLDAFVAGVTTKGKGGVDLAPIVKADGSKFFELTAEVTDWEVEPGKFVKAWTYNGMVPGPTLRVSPGDTLEVLVHNKLPATTSIHFHGLTTPNNMDGTTYVDGNEIIKSGTDYTYKFKVQDTPTVGMYHSHHDAVKQVPDGLAGAIIIGDIPLPASVDVPQSAIQQHIMMLNDSGVIGFALNGKSFPATEPYVAKQGEWLEFQYMNEGTAIHPMHLHGIPQLVIAKDGFPLANPQLEDTVTVAPGERYTVLVHATQPGVWVWHCHILTHAEKDTGYFGMTTALVVQ